ncbi:hypothetical protein ABFX02_12G159100 [Erythranthe guttata]
MASPDDSQTRPKTVDHQYMYNDNSNFQAQQQHHMYPQTPPVMYPIIPCPHPQAAYPYTPSPPQSSSFHHVSINYPYNNSNAGYYYNNNNNNSSNNYNQQPYIQGEIIRNETFSSSFGRMMLILMVVLVAAMCMMSLATWLLYGTYVPEFEVASLKVSNFSATNTTLRGTWIADVIVYNPNEELAVNFERVRSLVFYKGVIVGASTLDSFQVESNLRFNMNFSVAAAEADEERVVSVSPGSSSINNNNNNNNLHGLVLSALAQDWSNGAVVFSLRIALDAKLASPNQVYRQDNLRVSCDDLEVKFMAADMDEGRLSRGLGAQCLIRIRDNRG